MRDQIKPATRASGAEILLRYERRYPLTINTRQETELAATAAASLVDGDNIRRDLLPSRAAEEFRLVPGKTPGAYAWIGNGSGKGAGNAAQPALRFQ